MDRFTITRSETINLKKYVYTWVEAKDETIKDDMLKIIESYIPESTNHTIHELIEDALNAVEQAEKFFDRDKTSHSFTVYTYPVPLKYMLIGIRNTHDAIYTIQSVMHSLRNYRMYGSNVRGMSIRDAISYHPAKRLSGLMTLATAVETFEDLDDYMQFKTIDLLEQLIAKYREGQHYYILTDKYIKVEPKEKPKESYSELWKGLV